MTGGRFAGILGWPLEHTLSPAIHTAAFRNAGLDWVYLAWPVPPEHLAAAVAGLRALGCVGANVTMPHKENVIPLLDEISRDARAVGAVNTIQRVGEMLVGHNTDVDGFREFIEGDLGVSLSGRRALVLGAGGAARAVVKAMGDLDADEILVAARSESRGREVAALAQAGRGTRIAWDQAESSAGSCDVVVNATPIGAGGSAGDDPLPGCSWRPEQLVVDLIYSPPSTRLVERARGAGASAWGGLGMLVHQAASSFRIWVGQEAPLETMSAVAVRAIGQQKSDS